MIGFDVDFGLGQLFRSLSVEQWVLRAGVGVAAVACMFAASQASDAGLGGFWVLVIPIFAFWAVVSPDTAGPSTLLAALGLCWWTRVEDPSSGWLLLLVLGALVIHTCAALSSTGPPSARILTETWLRWGAAAACVVGVTALLWGVLAVADDSAVRASTMRLVVVLVAVAGLVWWIRRSSLAESRESSE